MNSVCRPIVEHEGVSSADPISEVVRHALFWLVIANAVGVWLAVLLLFPEWNRGLAPWTYGRWLPLHLNLHLYGWVSLPLLAWLFRMYQVDGARGGKMASSATWAWSLALAIGGVSWLQGHTSGKIFLDWHGFARWLLMLAMVFLWGALVWSRFGPRPRSAQSPNQGMADTANVVMMGAKSWPSRWRSLLALAGLMVLAGVPFVWFWAAGRSVYPSVNPNSGGPTGASLLGSTLIVLLLLLLLPETLGVRFVKRRWLKTAVWTWFLFNVGVYVALDKSHTLHTDWRQMAGLGSLVPWLVLWPAYYGALAWPAEARPWAKAFAVWFGLLALTGWMSFLPGWLDRLKFTDGLVAHSHLAMAGFITSFNIFLLIMTHPSHRARQCLAHRSAFWIWQSSLGLYLAGMWLSGWWQGEDPSFTIAPGPGRHAIYVVRLLCGLGMFGSSIYWWRQVNKTDGLTATCSDSLTEAVVCEPESREEVAV